MAGWPAGHDDEHAMLAKWLDLYRDVIVFKIEGLTEEQAHFSATPNGNSLLNLVVHLTGVERNWFQNVIAGRPIERDRDAEFGELDTTVDRAVAAYRDECVRSNEVLREAKLDEACAGEPGYSVRWVLHHMLEEVARHAGHADITRELIDGATGFSRESKN
jgi:hypothetical protein